MAQLNISASEAFIPEHYYYYDNTHSERITLYSLHSTVGPAKIQLIGIPTVWQLQLLPV